MQKYYPNSFPKFLNLLEITQKEQEKNLSINSQNENNKTTQIKDKNLSKEAESIKREAESIKPKAKSGKPFFI